MSTTDGEDDDGPAGNREIANRVFAAEYEQASVSYKEGDEERAPSYVVTPSGAKANRLFFVGVLTEIEDVNEDMLRARIVDPTGAFVVYAGQYQPDARTFFERASAPEFVAVSGKARTFQPDDSDRVFTSVRPESVNAVDADTRDRWALDAAEATLGRVAAMANALAAGADEVPAGAGLDPTGGIALALDHYGTTPGYLAALRDLSLDVARVVAGERDEVRPLEADPDDPTPADLAALTDLAENLDVGGEVPDAGSSDAVDVPGTAETTASGSPSESEEAETAADESGESGGSGDEAEPVEATAGSPSESEEAATAADELGGSGDEAEPVEATTAGSDATDGSADSGAETATTGSEGTGEEDLGDFEPGGFDADENGGDVEVEGSPDEMYELDEDERREIESEYDTEFSTGTEVGEPGEAGIETPDPEDVAADPQAGADADAGADSEPTQGGSAPDDEGEERVATDDADESGADDESEDSEEETAEPGSEEDAASDEDVDLDEYVIDRMRDLDDGDGADREELVAAVVDETGADPGDVEDAIQDALMGGQCYEPDDGALKPI